MKTIGDMSKYYTPEIEEFFVGFEYESKYLPKDEKFYKAEFEEGSICKMSKDSEYRVKHLDREDIESLGGKIIKVRDGGFNAQIYTSDYSFLDITYDSDTHKIYIEGFYQTKMVAKKTEGYDSHTIFQGIIKNKSEFKKLLKQLNING